MPRIGLVRIERNPNYGNTGLAFTDLKPTDDPYLFPPEPSKDIWAWAKEITERYGYRFHFDEDGQAILQAQNNPTRIIDLEPPALGGIGTLLTHPNAYAGTYIEFTGAFGPVDVEVNAARIDLVFPLEAGLGSWTVTVLQGVDVVAGPITVNPGSVTEALQYYDHRTRVDGTNATVATVFTGFYDTYTVRLQSSGGAGGTVRRLDAIMLWAVDPANPLWPKALTTTSNALKAIAQSANDDQRNLFFVVGRRKAIITDSAKLGSSALNPANEFEVAVSVDAASIANPYLSDDTTPNPNYTGTARETMIVNKAITDRDFAEYVARTGIYRYRLPNPPATVNHTLLPAVQLRDPVHVLEETYNTLDDAVVRYVSKIRHAMSFGEDFRALTDLDTSTFPEYPSYAPREDIDIDRFYNGLPVTNVEISYTSLDGTVQTNVAPGAAHRTDATDLVSVPKTAGATEISMAGEDWPPVPGTVFLTPPSSGVTFTDTPINTTGTNVLPGGAFPPIELRDASPTPIVSCVVKWGESVLLGGIALKTITVASSKQIAEAVGGSGYWYEFDSDSEILTVYRASNSTEPKTFSSTTVIALDQWIEVVYKRGPAGWRDQRLTNTPYHHFFEIDWSGKRLELPWQQADNSTGYQRNTNTFVVEYRRLGPVDGGGDFVDPYAGDCPFYDPYTSELGYLVSVKFDALISGLYRISLRSVYGDTIVAWLTNSTTDPDNEDSKWEYFTAGQGRQYYWDGVDNLGDWNARQSAVYADFAKGAFPAEERPVIGKGYYVWNREEAGAELALISGQRVGGKPVFGHGTYGEFYVVIEATNDYLEEIAEDAADELPIDTTLPKGTRPHDAVRVYSSKDIARVYTHLPAPTRVEIDWADWIASAPYDPTSDSVDLTSNWYTRAQADAAGVGAGSTDAIVNNRKPTRIRFRMQDRPGTLWDDKADEQDVRLFRVAHLRRNTMDQFLEFLGVNYAGKQIEQRRVVSRRGSNDDNTWVFQDDGFRKGKAFKDDTRPGLEWIFRPETCEKDFRGLGNEPLAFGDYLQLEEVPSWSENTPIAGKRSRFQIAFLNDLFYLSVFTQDRSGRYQWCINPYFLDKSKLLGNQRSHWRADADAQVRPTKWPDDPIVQHRRSIICRQWTDEYIGTQSYPDYMTATWNLSPLGKALCRHYWDQHESSETTVGTGALSVSWSSMGAYTGTDYHSLWHTLAHRDNDGRLPGSFPTNRQLNNALGDWDWETGPYWIPSITRDFHGYYCIPPMIDPPRSGAFLSFFFEESQVPESLWPVAINWPLTNFYGVVYVSNEFNSDDNTGRDAAMFTIWQSPVQDMTETYSSGNSGPVRFHSGASINSDDVINAKSLDYQRQDSLVHYEDLRGIYTRGPRPQEAPKKLDSIGPYFQNAFTYGGVVAIRTRSISDDSGLGFRRNQGILPPRYEATIQRFFSMSFRSEYVWESSGFYPVSDNGVEALGAVNWRIAKLPNQRGERLRYDAGAWTGWKDEYYYTGTQVMSMYRNVFDTKYLPWAPCTRLPQTTRMVFHLVLVNERRESPV